MFVNEPIRGQPASVHSGVAPCVRVRGKLDASPARLRLSAQLTANYKLESGPCVCVCECGVHHGVNDVAPPCWTPGGKIHSVF